MVLFLLIFWNVEDMRQKVAIETMGEWQPTMYLYMEKPQLPYVCHLHLKVEVIHAYEKY